MTKLRGFIFVAKVVLVLKTIESDDKTKKCTFCWHSKAETIINERDINDDVFKSVYTSYTTIISNVQNSRGKGSGWITNSVIDCNIEIKRDQQKINLL